MSLTNPDSRQSDPFQNAELVLGWENLYFLAQPDNQHLLLHRCLICKNLEEVALHFPVPGMGMCCENCGTRILNAFGDTAVYRDGNSYHGHERAYEEWLLEMNPTSVGGAVRRVVFERDGQACRYCGETSSLTIDHVIPKSRGGGHHASNLVTSCSACNTKKGARTPEEAGMPLRPLEEAQA